MCRKETHHRLPLSTGAMLVVAALAMQAASDNALELIHTLTVQYNRARQSQITTELAEIMGGRAGVE